MSYTPSLSLPLLAAAQAQKHVTLNEILAILDGLVMARALDRDLATPPGTPADGDLYIVATSGAGAWSGWDGSLALFTSGAWLRLQPDAGWRVWLSDEAVPAIYDGSAWVSGLAAASPFGARTRDVIAEEEVTLSGAATDTTLMIPTRSLIDAVSVRVSEAVTGATGFDVGLAVKGGAQDRYGGVGGTLGQSNIGIVDGVVATFAPDAVRLTATGGAASFSGGKVRVAVHFRSFEEPSA